MKKVQIFGLFVLLISISNDIYAQCSMCKAVLESNMQSGEQAVGGGVNSGILYIMFVPYLLLGAVGYFMYKHYNNTNKESSLK